MQEHVPILVGGSGERQTLRLAARYADACNVRGDPSTVARKVAVLTSHCAAIDRDPAEVTVTHLSTALAVGSRREVESYGPDLERFSVGTVEDHIGRYRLLAEAGVETAIVSLPLAAKPGALETFAKVVSAFAI
jgi:alkanesulfonate monooxygenase SsuD/methylene tetrahydromethanopterin reductase-like flavin-dependent oxidoreductase (luciferase family)